MGCSKIVASSSEQVTVSDVLVDEVGRSECDEVDLHEGYRIWR